MPVRPMTEQEFADWRATAIDAYTTEMADSGLLGRDEARRRAEEQHAELLPDGLRTTGHHLLRVLDDDGQPVGVLWLGPNAHRQGSGFVYDVEIDADHRGRGLGRAAMLAAEAVAREQGWADLGLSVFGPNTRARALYDSLGYSVVRTEMVKTIAG